MHNLCGPTRNNSKNSYTGRLRVNSTHTKKIKQENGKERGRLKSKNENGAYFLRNDSIDNNYPHIREFLRLQGFVHAR